VRSARPAHATLIADTLEQVLAALESADNYRSWILELADPHLQAPILELGAGRGTFTPLLAEKGRVCAVEPAEHLAAQLTAAVLGRPEVEVVSGTIDEVAAEPRFGSAVMFNVLEHVAHERALLDDVFRRLVPGGVLVLWVPAFEVLYSRFDEMLGHYRRYRLRPLIDLLEASSFEVLDARYVNLVGWLTWLIGARGLGRVPTSRRVISMFDRVAVPATRAVERHVVAPFGQSIFVAARRPPTS
jgi:SAM-dependent methyltransferase